MDPQNHEGFLPQKPRWTASMLSTSSSSFGGTTFPSLCQIRRSVESPRSYVRGKVCQCLSLSLFSAAIETYSTPRVPTDSSDVCAEPVDAWDHQGRNCCIRQEALGARDERHIVL